jgi:type I restriction enzyme R subunit
MELPPQKSRRNTADELPLGLLCPGLKRSIGQDLMKSVNFDFLRRQWAELATLGAFAEQYVHHDPESAAVKLRSYAEQLVEFIWHTERLPRMFRANLFDKMNDDSFKHAVPAVVITKLHALRSHGNKAAHGQSVSSTIIKSLLREAFDLGMWLFLRYGGGSKENCPTYQEPAATKQESQADSLRATRALKEQLAAQESQMQELLEQLEAERARSDQPEATPAELEQAQEAGQVVANELDFDEWTTRRRLIDRELISAGWDVGDDGANTAAVIQEMEIPNQPTDSGIGYADYVLWDENTGKPLAVIEAKKTANDVNQGRTQAELYADGLETKYGQRPVIFYTNGYDIWIWNDALHEPPRRLFGFYSRDSLDFLIFQRARRKPASEIRPDPEIAGRMYQLQAIRQVTERFGDPHRKALIVLATGTGKTRVAISLCKSLIDAGWAKRILFMCDRVELRKQANNAFKQFLPEENRVYVTARTSQDRHQRIYLATYPAMMKCFESFDVGFFDVIIADESHRSIYNRYGDLIKYFDGLLIGLTATPRDVITHNTYDLFGCEEDDPTAFYSYEDALGDAEGPFLALMRVKEFTTPFLRKGIKYTQLNSEQRVQLEEYETLPQSIEYEQKQVDKHIFNKDTNRRILRNLMENGMRNPTGSHVGKSIIFARNHNHAILLQNLFDELYPQYGGDFCRVIDNYDPRAGELIDDFRGVGRNPNLTIAISVDMLDTGIDIPEIVNLVFAKPVRSLVKFWQMIGRGTRLCPDLFGPGRDKKEFQIFDHWNNFYFFDMEGRGQNPPPRAPSLLERLFTTRIDLARTALETPDQESFELAKKLLLQDIRDLPERTISVREHWRQVKHAQREEVIHAFDPVTERVLRQEITPLMQWRITDGHDAAYKFDNLIGKLQNELLQRSSAFDDHKGELLNAINSVQMNLNPVRARSATIAEAKRESFWQNVTVKELERVRRELRDIMQFRQSSGRRGIQPKVIDVTEDDSLIEQRNYPVRLEGLDLAAYRARVEGVLRELFESNPTLQRIARGESVDKNDLQALTSLVLTQDGELDLNDLIDYYPESAGRLDQAIRRIIGRDAEQVAQVFSTFVQTHNLNSQQIAFLRLLQNYIARYGSIELERLYEDPFTTIHADGLDGVFADEPMAEELLTLIQGFDATSPKEGENKA